LAELDHVTKEEFIKMFDHLFFENRKKFEMYFISKNHSEEHNKLKEERLSSDKHFIFAKNYDFLKAKLPLFPDFYAKVFY